MGLLLSVLVGCVGVLELLACLKHVSDGMIITLNPPTPCLSYHDQSIETHSTHDSICSFSHSSDVRLPRSARHKLENLHEYSLRVRSELRSVDKNFDGDSSPSEWSTRDLLTTSRSASRPDSRLSPDFNLLVEDTDTWNADQAFDELYDDFKDKDKSYDDLSRETEDIGTYESINSSMLPTKPDRYVRIPTPIPFSGEQELSRSASSSDLGFDNDSGNEAPTMRNFQAVSTIRQVLESSMKRNELSTDKSDQIYRPIPQRPVNSNSRSPEMTEDSLKSYHEDRTDTQDKESSHRKKTSILKNTSNITYETDPSIRTQIDPEKVESAHTSQKKIKSSKTSTTILRKPTRLKSKNAEISKSAENLSEKKSKRHREPERRKSDISVQTVRNFLRDEWTNTSPSDSPVLSRSESKRSVSVEVQTSFEERISDDEALEEYDQSVIGLSESKRDLTSRDRFGRKSFKNKRFRSTSRENSGDDSKNVGRASNATATTEKSRNEKSDLRVSKFAEANKDDYERVKGAGSDSNSKDANGRRKENSSFEDDEEFVDAEDVSARTRPIIDTISDTSQNKAFWVIKLT